MRTSRLLTALAVAAAVHGCAAPHPGSSLTAPAREVVHSAHAAAIDSLLRASFPADGPGVAAIAVRGDEIVYRGAAGLANVELDVPMRPENVFNLYSVTKQFTGVATLLLAEEGKLSLTDPITRYFPDFPSAGRSLTVEHLLAHTSGMANYSDLDVWFPMLRQHVAAEDLIALFRNEPFRFEPGARWEYNNSGYVLLGKIIEQASGMTYGEFLRTRILAPLGMTSTHVYDAPGAVIPHRVAGYSMVQGRLRNAEYFSLTHGYAVGNMLSSVDDLARWNAAIDRGALLSPASWRRAFTSFVTTGGVETRYGAGWYIGRLQSLETLEHGGNLVGGMSQFLRIPAERLFVAVLMNIDATPLLAETLALQIAGQVLGVTVDMPEYSMTAGQLDEYVGVYSVGDGSARTINRRDTRLYSQRSGGQPLEIYPIGEDLFAFRSTGTWLRFERTNGRVSAMVLMPRIEPPGEPAPRVD